MDKNTIGGSLDILKNDNLNNQPKVAVILCTYNGERYIQDQLESILQQTYSNIDIHVQDDRSSDNTLKILEDYEKEGKIHLYKPQKNLGYPECFYDLMTKVIDADFFAFSDQDDVWYPDKIEQAVNLLMKADPNKPAIAFADYDVCDERLNILYTSPSPARQPDFLYSLYQCLSLGFATVLNRKAKEMIIAHRSVKNETKDVWIGMYCTCFGNAFYESKPCALHRRNPGAYSPQSRNFIEVQKDRIEEYLKGEGFASVYSVMQEFYEMFYQEMPVVHKNELELFLSKNLKNRLKKVFYNKRLRYKFSDEIMLRITFLQGWL